MKGFVVYRIRETWTKKNLKGFGFRCLEKVTF